MKPAWDDLGAEFHEHPSVNIIDVDCTGAGQAACGKHGVKGYPTIKYWTATGGRSGSDYQGGRDLKALREFVNSKLISCTIDSPKQCAENEQKLIGEGSKKSLTEVLADLKEREEKLKALTKERSAAQAELKAKEKEWNRNERNLKKAINIYKQFKKKLEKNKKTEL